MVGALNFLNHIHNSESLNKGIMTEFEFLILGIF